MNTYKGGINVKFNADVIIVGGGPSGLMIGNELAQFGVDALILEKRKTISLSRSGVIQPRVLEIFDSRGFVDTFINRAKKFNDHPKSSFGVWAGLPGVNYTLLDSSFQYNLHLTQVETEKILAERATSLGAHFRRNVEVTDVREHEDYVEVDIIDENNQHQTLTSQYVVGADGGRSTVRQSLGIGWTGHDATHSIVNLEVNMPFPWKERDAKVTDNEHGWGLAIPMESNLTRFTVIDAEETTEMMQNKSVDVEKVKSSIRKIFEKDFEINDVASALKFGDAMYMADKMQTDRVFLVGESVRIHYPAAGVGMNFCLQDAFNLGWKLAYAVKLGNKNGLLESYETERRPTIEKHLQNVSIQTGIQLNFATDMVLFKRYFEQQLLPIRDVNSKIVHELSGLSHFYGDPNDHSIVGKPMRDITITTKNGEQHTIFELLRQQQFLLIDLTNTVQPNVPADVKDYIACISGIADYREDLEGISTIFIRPDGHVAWMSEEPFNDSNFKEELARWFK
nr:FAD-dependent monooxygenase [Mammaliicoccus sciuri]